MGMVCRFCRLYIRFADGLNRRLGVIAWAVFILMFIMLYEVIARYVFNSPTKWAWDVNGQLLCFYTVMVGGYVLYQRGHIRSDLFYARWSAKKRALVESYSSFLPLLFFGAGVSSSLTAAVRSVLLTEHATTILGPPLYPLRIVIAIGMFLFLLQVIAEVMRNLLIVTGKLDSEER